MNQAWKKSELRDLGEKVESGQRLDAGDSLRLFQTRDLNALGSLANAVAARKCGNRATFILNRYINYSNYCILSCQFCSFARKKRDSDGFELNLDQILDKARQALEQGATELHIVGGLHPSLPFDYYLSIVRGLRELGPKLQLKCFTAIEILHLAWLAKKPAREVLIELKQAGLDALTGGGAEIFRKEVRMAIAKGKESAEEWLEVHRTWHQLGGRSTCTMLFGHVESLRDRVDHLLQLRALQDETRGFTGFVALPYQPENNKIPVQHPPTGVDILRTIAASRLILDNVDHITAYWVGLGLKLAQVALNYGADDLHGTIQEEHIFHMAGAGTPQSQSEATMVQAIRQAGRIPAQRNTFYEIVREWPMSGPLEETPASPDVTLAETVTRAGDSR